MMTIETCGKKIDTINVKISHRIIELFSAGLYSSPNKAFEELVCNSYDAFADKVAVYVPSDLTVDGAYIWVCDNGESMDAAGLKDLWKIGESPKRKDIERDKRRLQIGRFGIGKLATYILTNNLTYICKKNDRYLAATMNYRNISDYDEKLELDEREIDEKEVKVALGPYINFKGKDLLPFKLFGEKASKTWTFSIMTGLKTKAGEITEGRLKWILSTALPINPAFKLYYNFQEIDSSKISKPIRKSWVIGNEDLTAEGLDSVECRIDEGKYYIDFENLKGVHGQIDLYEDSLVDSSKSTGLGRSHGIFLMVRGRLVNLDDSLLGMEAFSHGAFNRTRIVINADELDDNLTSTREAIKDSSPLRQLKEYLKKKFNNEVRKFHFEEENRKEQAESIANRLAQTSLTISKKPLLVFAEKYFKKEIINPLLIEKPNPENQSQLLTDLKKEVSGTENIIKNTDWCILDSGAPIGKLDLLSGLLKINLVHPYIANYIDAYKSKLPLQFIVIAEVLTEAHLYELGLDETIVNSVMRRRDSTLRELSLSNRESSPAVAQMLKDSMADETGLEDAVCRAFLSLGFEATRIGGNGKPDGKADAFLGYSTSEKSENYSLTYDAKSTSKTKIKAGTAKLSGIKRHQLDYKAEFAVVVARDFEGANDPSSAISQEAKQQKVTAIRTNDLMRLLLLAPLKQIGLRKMRKLFEDCHSPEEVKKWIDNIENEEIIIGPIKELLETIYSLQCTDTEPPELASIRMAINEKISKPLGKMEIKSQLESLRVLVPGFISIEDEKVFIQGNPEMIMGVINQAINNYPHELQGIYLKAFSSKS